MGMLYLVRHGQASLMSADYDRLSPLGEQQSAALGAYWARRAKLFHAVYIGPKRRHRQTYDACAAAARRAGFELPPPQTAEVFDEHQGFQVVRAALPDLAAVDPFIAAHYNGGQMNREQYLTVFRAVTRRWAAGELSPHGLENWQQFRARVGDGLAALQEATADERANLLVFTSGGAIAAAVGRALDLNDEKTLELSWIIRNSAYTEFAFNARRLTLLEFNALPHLDADELRTYV